MQALLGEAIDLSDAAFPYMAAAETRVGAVTARVFRLSFSGELAYEIAVPAQFGDALIRAIMRAGQPLGVQPYGLEALGVMRIEKGHVAGGELNGQTTAGDLGLSGLMSKRKDFVGKALAARPGLIDRDRPTLVGLRAADGAGRFRAGARIVPASGAPSPETSLGHVSSAVWSPTLEAWIGLGFVRGGPARHAEIVRAWDPVRGADTPVEVCSPVFIDPEGRRLRG
jgi:sarcosine oxidase subunit alpha